MVRKDVDKDICRLRIDPVLVDKFRRLPAGINEVGTKIVRDLGLRYQYDKNRGTLEITGPDTEILALAAETLRFWVEDDDFPDTGITCQVGYPNRSIVIWRFHGDYAKKFDHLFADDIANLKLITSVNIKAVPSKRNPEYIELYCHFSVYHQVKPKVMRISKELGKIFQDDFFIPNSDFLKARNFARSKISDNKVLYALKEYPDNKVRVWLFARDHMDILRARREWVLHVGIIARDNEFTETVGYDNSIKSASFYGHPASELGSDMSGPAQSSLKLSKQEERVRQQSKSIQITQTSLNLSPSRLRHKSTTRSSKKDISPRGIRLDNSNFPRPPDFVYPVQKKPIEEKTNETNVHEEGSKNLFEANAEILEDFVADGEQDSNNPSVGDAKWIPEGETNSYRTRKLSRPLQNRIYVHHQINEQLQNQQQPQRHKQVLHPETNLIERERFNPTHHSKSVLTSVTDPRQAPAIKRGNKGVRPRQRASIKPGKVNATTRQKRPFLRLQKHPNIRYNINVNGLDIYMYKQDITKLDNMDALVNVVAPSLKEGDHIAKTILAEAGKKVMDELDVHLRLYGEARMSENVVTSAGKLPALGMIHVVSPIWKRYTVWQDCASDLHKALYGALKTAESHKYRRIGIPTIGSEHYFGIPKDLVAEVYVKALIDYSMGMGPMFPVLEVHLVDTDHNMLTYIKDAYESWASTPGVADMTQHITQESDHIIKDPNEVSTRAQSAVNLKSMPSHRSENMVTFTGQSYTKEGEQKWTFDVLKKLTVHVYTGSVLELNDVEAIVCAVDANMKGTLVKQVQALGGKSYKTSLKNERGNRTLVEGEVLVCDAGELGMRKVLHSVISTPIRHINQRNLSRLDSINTQVLYAASQNGIKVLAMPLIGTGRLRERFEVEQCSLQLIDNVIELCLSLGRGLKIKQLHLVNTNHVMTQYLTQALRTRGHTKLRVETESHVPSRQEVFEKAEAIRGTPEKFDKTSARSAKSVESNKITDINTTRDKNEKQNRNINNSSNDKPDEEAKIDENDKDTVRSIIKTVEDQTETSYSERRQFEFNETYHNTDVNNKLFEKKSKYEEHTPYLSQKNLKTHNRLVHGAWMHLMENEIKTTEYKTSKGNNNTEELKRHKKLEPLHKKSLITKAQEFLNERKSEKNKTQRKKKHRIIQRSSDFVVQKSKALSYTTLYEKKQKYVEQVHKEEQLKLRKTQSSDDIWKKQIADKVFETFKEERNKLSRQKRLSQKASEDLTEEEKMERDKFLNETKKYFTRDTKDRYKENASEMDVNDISERINRINVNEDDVDKDDKLYAEQSMTERFERQRPSSKSKKLRSEKFMIDNEREDQYMMDMDFFAKERKEWERQKADTNVDTDHDKSSSKSEKSRKMRRDRLIAMTSSDKKLTEWDQHIQSIYKNQPRRQSTSGDKQPRQDQNSIQLLNDSAVTPGNDKYLEKELSINSQKEIDIKTPISKEINQSNQNKTNAGENVDVVIETKRNTSQALKSGKSYKNYTVTASKEEGYPPNDNVNSMNERSGRQETGRVQFVQAYSSKPISEPEISKLTKTVDWKNRTKITKGALRLFNEQRRNAKHAPRSDKVSIKDNLKLHINVVDNKTKDSDKVEEEKKKIRRFWKAVDGKEIKDDKEMFGEKENKDKMLVAKVTKERIMSAKTKVSKQSKGSVVTHNVGDYNVTLEVGN